MAARKQLPNPKPFSLNSFADLIKDRGAIPGERPGSFHGFHAGLMKDLQPFAPYEMVLAENLIAIEWEMIQHRRMRNQVILNKILDTIWAALVAQRQKQHRENTGAAREAWTAAGHEPRSFKADEFDQEAAERAAMSLAHRSVDPDPQVQDAAHAEVGKLGIHLLSLMGEAYRDSSGDVLFHEDKLQEMERRRRGLRAEIEALKKLRPIDAEPADVSEAGVVES